MAGWPPEKNTAFVWEFYLRDADGDLIAGATALDVEFSIDGGVFADVAGTEVDEGEGLYSCPISAGEMNGDRIALICKTSTGGVKSAAVVIYTSVRQIDDLAFPVTSGRGIQVETDGMIHADIKEVLGVPINALVSGRMDSDVGAIQDIDVPAIWLASIATQIITTMEDIGLILNRTTIATLASQTSFTLTAGSADDTAYLDCIAVIEDASTAVQKSVGIVQTYTGGSRTIALRDDNVSGFTIAVGDTITILPPVALVRAGIRAGNYNAGAIGAVAIASDAIGAAELATDAVNKIRDAILSDSTSFPGASITEVRMAALTDWINGGRLDLLLDAIKVVTDAQTATGAGLTGIPWNASYHAYDGPRGPGVYLNDVAANTNTVNGTDGIIGNPVSTIVAAKTIADSLSYDRIYLINDSAITLTVTMADYEFVGIGELAANSVDLGSQNVNNSSFYNVMVVGTHGGTGRISIFGGAVSGVVNLHATAIGCALLGNITLDAGNDTYFVSCWSGVAGTGTHEITFTANANLSVRHFSGGLQINSMAATNLMSFEAVGGQIIADATCTGGIVATRGNLTKTDNSGGAVTFSEDARIDIAQILAQVTAALATYDGPTNTEMNTAHALLATEAKQDVIDSLIDAIKVKTDALPSGPAKNVALANFGFLIVLSSDDKTPGVGLTVTGQVSIDGAAFTGLTNSITEIANGLYKVNLTAAELNGDVIILKFTAATANQRTIVMLTT